MVEHASRPLAALRTDIGDAPQTENAAAPANGSDRKPKVEDEFADEPEWYPPPDQPCA